MSNFTNTDGRENLINYLIKMLNSENNCYTYYARSRKTEEGRTSS